MTRRMFVKTASAFAGGAVFGMDFSAKANMKLAFQTYAIRDLCEKDFAGTLKAAKVMGFEGVETGRFYGFDAKGLKAACDEAGLELVALQLYPHCLTEPQLAETIKFCKESGAKRINVAWYKGSAENANSMESRMREIRMYGLTRVKSHRRQRRGVGLYSTKVKECWSLLPSSR